MSNSEISRLLTDLNSSIYKDDILQLVDVEFDGCQDIGSCSTGSTRLTNRNKSAFPNDGYPMTIAQELANQGYTKQEIADGLRNIAKDLFTSYGARAPCKRAYLPFITNRLCKRWNSDCAPQLSDLSESVATLVAGPKDKRTGERDPLHIIAAIGTIENAKKMLNEGEIVTDNIIKLKKVAKAEEALAREVSESDAFNKYRDFMLSTLLLVMNTGKSVEGIKKYLDTLAKEVRDTSAVGAGGAGSGSASDGGSEAGGRHPTGDIVAMGGRASMGSSARVAAIRTALMAGDVKYLAMLDMVDVNLSQADRVRVAQLYASSGDSLRDFESNVHKSLGGRAVGALRDVGLL
jgi:hypothetical protein